MICHMQFTYDTWLVTYLCFSKCSQVFAIKLNPQEVTIEM